MTAKENKENFISHYLEDWIPEQKWNDTIARLDDVIELYCEEQREMSYEVMGEIEGAGWEEIRKAKIQV